MLIVDTSFIFLISLLYTIAGDDGTVKSLCTHLSTNDISIINSYQVNNNCFTKVTGLIIQILLDTFFVDYFRPSPTCDIWWHFRKPLSTKSVTYIWVEAKFSQLISKHRDSLFISRFFWLNLPECQMRWPHFSQLRLLLSDLGTEKKWFHRNLSVWPWAKKRWPGKKESKDNRWHPVR